MATGPRDPAPKHSPIVANAKPPSRPLTAPVSKLALRPAAVSVGRKKFPRVASWAAIATVLVAVGAIAGCSWIGIQLIVSPQTLLWINRFLPDWIPIPVTGLKPPQTLEAIREEIIQAGQQPGELLPLGKNTSALDHKSTVSDVLLPVLEHRSNCQNACDQLVELRVYQTTPTQRQDGHHELHYQLLDQRAILGPDESFVLAPLINAGDVNQGSTRSLPLMTVNRFEGTVPPEGVWLNLSGRWQRGDTTIAYGQVMYYNPEHVHLHLMVEWSSPNGQDPVWREVTGGGLPELVVDQTVGMEPQFQIYQVKPRNFLPSPLQLEPISLLESALDEGTYENGLLLARSGLWSTGWQWLQSVKQRHARDGQWSSAAQAQLELIALHARATQSQADKSWASPGQQVFANLVDGRWGRALTVFEASAENSQETETLLKTDYGRLQTRVDTALRISPMQADIRAWGALLIAARQGRNAAIAWLKKQPNTTSTEITRVNALITHLEAPSSEALTTATLPPGQLVGSAQILTGINVASWLKPKGSPALKLDSQQGWYQVQVAGFQDGKQWRFANPTLGLPAGATADTIWKQLGLTADPLLEITFWLPDGQQQTISASIKAVRMNAGGLQLLAAGETVSRTIANASQQSRPLAFTDAALQWQTPETTPLADLVQQQPEWAINAIPRLGRELKRAGKIPPGIDLTWDALAPLIGHIPAQLATLTGSGQPDIILAVDPTALDDPSKAKSTSQSAKPRTLIFSPAGKLLYSEFSTEADLTYLAIATLGTSNTPAIVADGPRNYSLLRWSAKRQRFE